MACLRVKCWCDSREDVVDADDAVRTRRAAIVNYRGVTLHPNPSAMFGQEAVISSGHLTFDQHCRERDTC